MTYPSKPETGTVLHWREGAVAHIRFNRPQALNAIDVEMAEAFYKACKQVATDPLVRAVWITAAGRAFMAGGDISAMARNPETIAQDLITNMHGALRVLAQLDAPVVASVQGAVAGGGLGLVLGGADLIVAAEGTKFGIAYPLIGASCDCSTSWALPRIVGLHKALELALLGDTVDATQALTLGLCNRVVPAAELDEVSETLVTRLASGPTRALGKLRRLVRASVNTSFDVQLDEEAKGFCACATTADFKEGVDAFISKRKAFFQGN
jgi:2-(1,2-epoxy-1,2-dihydrophenyl)acetyl-CoA isomerase